MEPKFDPAFEEAVNAYAESVVAMEKEEFRPGIEPFELHANKVRTKVAEAMHSFYNTYAHGYQVLLDELAKMIPASQTNVDPLEPFKAKDDQIQKLDDPAEFMNFLTEGHSIYEALGFTMDEVARFYDAAISLLDQKRFEDARDGFYFLVTIAPLVGESWLGLGFSYAECGDAEAAIQACAHAVDLMPEKPDAYLTFARVFIDIQDFDQAQKVCDIAISYAKENSDAPWAKELIEYMEEAKRQIDTLFQKSQSQTYSS